jgi:hypothetical protein
MSQVPSLFRHPPFRELSERIPFQRGLQNLDSRRRQVGLLQNKQPGRLSGGVVLRLGYITYRGDHAADER